MLKAVSLVTKNGQAENYINVPIVAESKNVIIETINLLFTTGSCPLRLFSLVRHGH